MTFPAQCVQCETHQRVIFEENRKSFCLLNQAREKVRKVVIDGCLIRDLQGQLACDFGCWPDNRLKAYLIELKGKNILHAIRQILETLKYIQREHSDELNGRTLEAVIVSSRNKVPALRQTPDYVNLRKRAAEIHIKNNYLELTL